MNYSKVLFFINLLAILSIEACQTIQEEKKLPVLGRREVVQQEVNGKMEVDTVYHTIPDFKFINQDSSIVTPSTFDDKIYIADFFFTTCPTICPTMKAQMLRVYQEYEDNDQVMILSHSIDPEYDTVAVLREFARRLGVSSEKWHFITGSKKEIYDIGQNAYMVTAKEDENEPGGYIHSGAFILIDKDKRIRGYYDGTKQADVNRLIQDIPILLKEYEN
ncbi:MAG: SCO family protein [Candidatus Cyclobacteriaceae bacterium M3_2C_046]